MSTHRTFLGSRCMQPNQLKLRGMSAELRDERMDGKKPEIILNFPGKSLLKSGSFQTISFMTNRVCLRTSAELKNECWTESRELGKSPKQSCNFPGKSLLKYGTIFQTVSFMTNRTCLGTTAELKNECWTESRGDGWEKARNNPAIFRENPC